MHKAGAVVLPALFAAHEKTSSVVRATIPRQTDKKARRARQSYRRSSICVPSGSVIITTVSNIGFARVATGKHRPILQAEPHLRTKKRARQKTLWFPNGLFLIPAIISRLFGCLSKPSAFAPGDQPWPRRLWEGPSKPGSVCALIDRCEHHAKLRHKILRLMRIDTRLSV
jgi:hypothetical protein